MTDPNSSPEEKSNFETHPLAAKAFGLNHADLDAPDGAQGALTFNERRVMQLDDYDDALDYVDSHPDELLKEQVRTHFHSSAEDFAANLLDIWNRYRIMAALHPGACDNPPINANKTVDEIRRCVCEYYGAPENTSWDELDTIADAHSHLYGILADAAYPPPGESVLSIRQAFADYELRQRLAKFWDHPDISQ